MARMQQQQKKTGLLIAIVVTVASLGLGGCNRARVPFNRDDYVEIDNPIIDGNAAENTKIWVPKSSLSQGVPRGRELVQKGYDSIAGPDKAPATAAAGATDGKGSTPRHRLFIAAKGGAALDKPLADLLANRFVIKPVTKSAPPVAATPEETLAYAAALAAQAGSGPLLLISVPEESKPGAVIKAELIDSRGPILLRTLTVKIPPPEKDESLAEATERALSGLAGATRELLNRLSWYGQVVRVSNDRVYLDAGRESGLTLGQRLRVYRGGETVKGIGFAPGAPISGITLQAFVGPDGAYGTSLDAGKLLPGDFVELDQ